MFIGGTTLALRLPSCRCRPPPTQEEPQLSSPLIQISPVSQSPQVSEDHSSSSTHSEIYIECVLEVRHCAWHTRGYSRKSDRCSPHPYILHSCSCPLPTPPVLPGTFRSTAENSAPWQNRGGRRMLLTLFRMALDHVGPETTLFGR